MAAVAFDLSVRAASYNQGVCDLVLSKTSAPVPEPIQTDPALGLISVIIVNFNSGDYLRSAIDSVFAQNVPDSRVEVIVVDNRSTDDSLDRARAEFGESTTLTIIEEAENLGFAQACNIGLQNARGAYLLFLNPDCRMLPGSLCALRDALIDDELAGMAGARLTNPDGSEQRGARRDIPNPWMIFCEVLQLHRLMSNHPRFRSFNLHAEALPDGPTQVQAISGACMMVRREAIATVGQLDNDYFLHFEDLDWCLRFSHAKSGVLFVPGAQVVHVQGVCSASRPIRVAYEKHRSLIRFLRKHFTTYYPSSFMALVTALVTIRFIVLVPRIWLRTRAAPRQAIVEGTQLPASDP